MDKDNLGYVGFGSTYMDMLLPFNFVSQHGCDTQEPGAVPNLSQVGFAVRQLGKNNYA